MSKSNGVREGVVTVVRRGARFLLIRRAAGIIAGGAWCFVGGGIEAGESQAEAARREFMEEVGGRVVPQRKLWEWVRPDGKLKLHWWLCGLADDELTANPAEVAELGWFTLDEIRALPELLASNVTFIEQFGENLLSEDGVRDNIL